MVHSILAKLDPSQIVYEPFPHLHAENCLDPDYYSELDAAFPSTKRVVCAEESLNNHAYFMSTLEVLSDPQIPEIWRDFFTFHTSTEFLQEYLAFWKRAIEREYSNLEQQLGKSLGDLTARARHPGRRENPENAKADFLLDCQFGINSPVTTQSSVRGPHIDLPYKLFNALLYFREENDMSTGGEFLIHRAKTRRVHQDENYDIAERSVYEVAKVPYRANTLIMMLNTSRSIHGVAPRQPTEYTRRYVNLLGECYSLPTKKFFQKQRTIGGRAAEKYRRLFESV